MYAELTATLDVERDLPIRYAAPSPLPAHPYNTPTDGRFRGTESITTVSCDQSAGTCAIAVPAPGLALVFLSPSALAASEPQSTVTFSTSTVTGRQQNTATVDPAVLATSNGHTGADRAHLESTSRGSGAAPAAAVAPGLCTLAAAVLSAVLVLGVAARS